MARLVYASIDDLIKSSKDSIKYIEVEGFNPGEVFRIKSLTASEMAGWTRENDTAKSTAGLRLILLSLVGPPPENKKYTEPKHLGFFKEQSHEVMERIVAAILQLNKIGSTIH